MAATQAKIGFGTLLQRGDGGSPEVYTTILEITSITGPSLARETVDATHYESPSGYREFLGGLIDGGEVTFEGNWVPRNSTHDATTGLLTEMASSDVTIRNWRILLTGTPTAYWIVAGFLTRWEASIPVDGKLSFSGTIKVSGKPAITTA